MKEFVQFSQYVVIDVKHCSESISLGSIPGHEHFFMVFSYFKQEKIFIIFYIFARFFLC